MGPHPPEPLVRGIDGLIAAIAERQHGVVARAQLGALDALSLADLVLRYPGRRGVVAIRRIVDAGRIGATITHSELEDRFLAVIDGLDLPRPESTSTSRSPLASSRPSGHLAAPGR